MGRHLRFVVLAIALAACGGGGGGGGPKLQSISLAPGAASLAIAQSQQYIATGHYSDGSTRDLTATALWSSTSPAVASVNAAGLASAASAGTTMIRASASSITGSTALTVAPDVPGATVWNFDNPADRFARHTGGADLGYRDPLGSGWGPAQTTFAKASALGLPLLAGADTDVMAFPATGPEQGYTLTHHAPANGVFAGDGKVSNYTLIMDLYLPVDGGNDYRALFQADPQNADDAEMFVRDMASGNLGIGINSYYNEYYAMAPGSWHRIAIVVQCAIAPGGTGMMSKYIDGLFVGGQYTPLETPNECRWALGPTLQLFTDDDDETAAGYVSSILFTDRLMMPDEIAALGGPNAAGASVPGAAAPAPPQVASDRVMIFGHRTNTGRTPENTLAGLAAAFEDGADHVEADVRATSDGKLVLMHDPTVDRTTDGTGAVDALTLSAIQLLDSGSWFDAIFAGEHVPTLVQALTAAAGHGRILLDIKLPGLGAPIKAALDEAGVTEAAIWASKQGITPSEAADLKDNLPNAGILWSEIPSTLDPAAFDDLKAQGAVGFDVDYTEVTQAFVDAAHANGMFVVVYTILDPDTMLAMIALGVDGMETDYPAVLDSLMPPPLGP